MGGHELNHQRFKTLHWLQPQTLSLPFLPFILYLVLPLGMSSLLLPGTDSHLGQRPSQPWHLLPLSLDFLPDSSYICSCVLVSTAPHLEAAGGTGPAGCAMEPVLAGLALPERHCQISMQLLCCPLPRVVPRWPLDSAR